MPGAAVNAAVVTTPDQSGRLVPRIFSARQAAPKPLSMFTTATPGLQLASIVFSATTPPWATPVPTDVGTPITGARNRPATTAGNAPSIPATTMHTRAAVNSGKLDCR